jgi:PKD-like domain
MHKKVLVSLVTLLFFWLEVKSQITPPCANPPPQGANNCNQTCVYCDFDGYSGISGGTPSTTNVICGQIVIHNDQWLSFVATSPSMSIEVTSSNCVQGQGVQVAFFESCTAVDALGCNPGVIDGEGVPLALTYNNFVPGQTYYLMIDGSFGDVCNFDIDITAGSVTPPPPGVPQQPVGPTALCPGATAVYTIPPVNNASWYRWTGPAGSRINGTNSNTLQISGAQGTTVTITFGNNPLNGTVCVGAGNACFPANTTCLPVQLTNIPVTVKPPLTLCFEDRVFTNPESPYNTITLPVGNTTLNATYDSYRGCDSIVRQVITVKSQPIKDLGNKYVCQGECFDLNGISYCTPGIKQQPVVYDNACDTILRFNVVIIPSNATIPAVPQIDCSMPNLTLTSTGSTTSSGAMYRWTNATWATIGTGTTQNVSGTGVYHLIVTTTVVGTTCRDTATVNVTSTAAFPGATASGGAISCSTPNVTLQSSSPSSGVNYQWSGPGINAANQFLQNPVVSTAGTYIISVTNPSNGCTSTATAVVVPNDTLPTAMATGGAISCTQPSITLDGSSNVPNATYTWSGPGITAGNMNQENPAVIAPGSYALTVTNPANGCSQTAASTVNQNNTPPVANAGADQNITCQQTSVTLNGSASGTGPFQYLWTGPGINAVNQNQQMPAVTAGGTYTLNVLDTSNGCSHTDVVVITDLIAVPTANAGPDGLLNCGIPTINLNGASSSQGANFSALWTGPGINAGNQNSYSPQVNLPGTYILTITNTVNQCTATDNVLVTLDNTVPTVNAGSNQILTCSSVNGINLNGSGTPAGITYLWTGPGINAGNQNQQTPNISLPGTYTLQVTDPANQCTATDQVIISQDANAPVAVAGNDQAINCTVTSVTLGSASSSSGNGIGYSWTGPGITMLNQNQLMPVVTDGGTYILTVSNSTNGCVSTDTVLISKQVTLPNAQAGTDSTLNCVVLTLTLNGSSSSQGPNFTALWTGPSINAGNQNTYAPQVNLPGTYTLMITDISNNCTATDQVVILQDNTLPTANAGNDEVLTCTTPNGIALNGGGSPATITYLWTGPGITTGNATLANPTINDPGTYILTVMNTVNLCTATDQVVITEDSGVPMADAGGDLTITCSVTTVSIDASASTSGTGIEYLWTGPGISGANSTAQNPQNITLPGTYNLTVTNINNSCSNTDVVLIAIDTISPLSSAGADLTLNCYNNNADTLDASASSTGPDFSLLWTGPAITAINQNSLKPVVNQAGTYSVLITNLTNNCTASAEAIVVSDTLSPVADAGVDGIIDCGNSSVSVGGNSSSGPNFEYLWNGAGIDASNEALATLTVTAAGVYNLLVSNTSNGCTAVNDVLIEEDLVYPLASAGVDTVITCTNSSITLDGSASSAGANIQIQWSGLGISTANESDITPDITQPDNYILTVTNTTNNCVTWDTIVVLEDQVLPIALAGADALLDCQTTSTVLDGSGSSVGLSMTYLWTGPGITTANEAQQNPSIGDPGAYTLLVTNTANGCSDQDEVVVTEDVILPVANAGSDLILDCQFPIQAIDGSGSSTGATMEYLWQGAGINSSNFNVISPMVSDSGLYTVTVTNIQNHCTHTDFVYVGLNADLPVTSAGTDRTLTCAVDTLQLDGALSQSGPNIVYAWSGPGVVSGEETLSSPQIYEPGDYTLTVTNISNGCSNTDLVAVAQDTVSPLVLAGDDQILTCLNSATGVTLSSTGSSSGVGFVLQWSGSGITPANETSASPLVTGVGPYVLTITNTINGCTNTDVVVVEQDQDAPTSIAGSDQTITCVTTAVSLDGSSSTSPSGLLEFIWSGPGVTGGNQNDASIQVSQSGTYTLTIVNPVSGCQAVDNVVVNLDTAPPTASAVGDTITCQTPTGALSASSSAAGSTFTWSGPGINTGNANQAMLQVNQPGNYSVTVTAANGCTDEALVIMHVDENFPVGAAEGDQLNCSNNGIGAISGTVTTAGASFFWSGPNGFNATTPTATVTVAGVYTFNIVANNGCINPIPVTVSADFTEPAVFATVPGTLNCSTTSLSINGTGTLTGSSITYEWSTNGGNIVSGANTLTPVVDAPGAYTILVSNLLNGCTSTESVLVENDPNIPTALELNIRDIKCFGEQNGAIVISSVNGGIEPFVFSLNGGTSSTIDQYTGLEAGDYAISMEDANGCVLDTLVSVAEPAQLLAELGPDIAVHLGDSVSVNAEIMNETPIANVTWNFSPNRIDTECCSFSYQPLQTQRHEVTVIDSNGCVARDVVTVTVSKDRQVFIPNIINLNSDNPISASLMIQGGNDVVKIHKWLIFDRWGNAVHEVRNFLPNDPAYAWNGNVRGEKGQPGVFAWAAEIEFLDGQMELFEGDVTIMR